MEPCPATIVASYGSIVLRLTMVVILNRNQNREGRYVIQLMVGTAAGLRYLDPQDSKGHNQKHGHGKPVANPSIVNDNAINRLFARKAAPQV